MNEDQRMKLAILLLIGMVISLNIIMYMVNAIVEETTGINFVVWQPVLAVTLICFIFMLFYFPTKLYFIKKTIKEGIKNE